MKDTTNKCRGKGSTQPSRGLAREPGRLETEGQPGRRLAEFELEFGHAER